MYLPVLVEVPAFVDESVSLDLGFKFGRGWVVKGVSSGRPYLIRRGLLEAVAERLYYQWSTARGIAVRPVQFIRAKENSTLSVRHSAAVWWTDGQVGKENHMPCDGVTNSDDIPKASALDLLLDNSNKFSGWMFDEDRAFKLFNHHTLGLGFGPIPMLTRYRLVRQVGISPHMDLESFMSSMSPKEKVIFINEAKDLSALDDITIRNICRLPDDIGIEAFKLCSRALGVGAGSRDTMKLLLKDGPAFLEEFASEYIICRKRVLTNQLRILQRA
jgi:hypothetical protein